MSIHTMMNTTCDIKVESQTKDHYGANSAPVLTVTQASVPCRACDLTPQQVAIYYGKYDSKDMKRFYIDQSWNLIAVKSWINFGGIDYNVMSVENAGGTLNKLWQVDAVQKPFM
jgi:hypothetical protein